jgi:hypothetical protein
MYPELKLLVRKVPATEGDGVCTYIFCAATGTGAFDTPFPMR